MPSNYTAKSETEKALHESLRSMELQCKERVDLFEALKKSRQEAEDDAKNEPSRSRESLASINRPAANGEGAIWLGGDTIPPVTYADLPRTSPSVPQPKYAPPPRPSHMYGRTESSNDIERSRSLQPAASPALAAPASTKERARTPSPDKKAGGMLKTLRSAPKERPGSGKIATTMRSRPPPAASKAASQVWAPATRPSSNTEARSSSSNLSANATSWDPYTRSLVDKPSISTLETDRRTSDHNILQPPSPSDYIPLRTASDFESSNHTRVYPTPYPDLSSSNTYSRPPLPYNDQFADNLGPPTPPPPPPPPHRTDPTWSITDKPRPPPPSISQLDTPSISYMKEFPNHPPIKPQPPEVPGKRTPRTSDIDGPSSLAQPKTVQAKTTPIVPRKAVSRATGVASATAERQKLDNTTSKLDEKLKSSAPPAKSSLDKKPAKRKTEGKAIGGQAVTPPTTDDSHGSENDEEGDNSETQIWDRKVKKIMKDLPRGVSTLR